MLSLLLRNGAGDKVPPALRRQLRRWVERAMAAAGFAEAAVCLSLSDDDELHQLNRAYAGEDHATDVLSFALQEAPAVRGGSKVGPLLLGDIVISVPIAEQQAAERGHGLEAELLHLAVHGFCHLLGYDHATVDEERLMFGYETLLRAQARSGRPLQAQQPPPLPRPPQAQRRRRAAPSSERSTTRHG
jgi:probable rRNA maturation factor